MICWSVQYAIQTYILAAGKFDIVRLSNKVQYCHSNCFESTCKVQSDKIVCLENGYLKAISKCRTLVRKLQLFSTEI